MLLLPNPWALFEAQAPLCESLTLAQALSPVDVSFTGPTVQVFLVLSHDAPSRPCTSAGEALGYTSASEII